MIHYGITQKLRELFKTTRKKHVKSCGVRKAAMEEFDGLDKKFV